jgi:hypothetical protein
MFPPVRISSGASARVFIPPSKAWSAALEPSDKWGIEDWQNMLGEFRPKIRDNGRETSRNCEPDL